MNSTPVGVATPAQEFVVPRSIPSATATSTERIAVGRRELMMQARGVGGGLQKMATCLPGPAADRRADLAMHVVGGVPATFEGGGITCRSAQLDHHRDQPQVRRG